MLERPSTKYYCEMCQNDHAGRPTQTGAMLRVGCCFDLQWSGTRENATELYDYLVGEGLVQSHEQCANGCIDFNDEEISEPRTVWACGRCTRKYDEQSDAHECCLEAFRASQAELMDEEAV